MSPTGLEPDRRRREPSEEELRRASGGRRPDVPDGGRGPDAARSRAHGAAHDSAVPRLLADGTSRTIVRALADGPRRPSELERLPGIARSSLYARLAELTERGAVASRRFGQFPLRVEYRLSSAGRSKLAHELLIERWERRRLARVGPGAEAGLTSLVRLLAPVARMPDRSSATCVLVEHEPPGEAEFARLVVEGGRIALSDPPALTMADAQVRAEPRTWDRALLSGPSSDLWIRGDEGLAHTVVTALGVSLRV